MTIAQDGDRLNYELFDKISYNLSRGCIPTLPGTPIEKTIRDLTKSEPIINDEKQPEFGQVRAKWILENGELSLLHLKNDLIWQLFEKSTQKNSRMPFDINLLQLMCAESKSNQSSHEAFKKEWQKLNTDSPDEIVRFLKKNAQVKASYSYNTEPNHHADEKKIGLLALKAVFTSNDSLEVRKEKMEKITANLQKKATYYSLSNSSKKLNKLREIFDQEIFDHLFITNNPQKFSSLNPFKVEIGHLRMIPRMDKHKQVDRYTWAITIIAEGGIGISYGMCCKGNHAEIITEGFSDGTVAGADGKPVKEGKYFVCLSHHTGNEIESKMIDPEKLRYKRRTPTWLASSSLGKKMLEEINKDLHNTPKFSITGTDSIFSKGKHSCFTWSTEKAAIANINLPKSKKRWLYTKTNDYTFTDEEYYAHIDFLESQNKSRIAAVTVGVGLIPWRGATGALGVGGVGAGIAAITADAGATCVSTYKKSTQFQEWKVKLIKESIRKAFNDFIDTRENLMELCCPLQGTLFEKPVRAPDGKVYEEKAILHWLRVKPKSKFGSPFRICDFEEKDLVYDYKMAAKVADAIINEMNNFNSTGLHPKVRSGLNNLMINLTIDRDYAMKNWMNELAIKRKKESQCIHILLEKFAFLCHEFGVKPDDIDVKCRDLLKKEWDKEAKDHLQWAYDEKKPLESQKPRE
ncbi:U-box domain-containing protein [Parachlamydia sp.]|uniref:U-box domain-containing protein n=1 Tax=Parachlamydia sp. TaxID=2052048 RepID=UPI003D096E4C